MNSRRTFFKRLAQVAAVATLPLRELVQHRKVAKVPGVSFIVPEPRRMSDCVSDYEYWSQEPYCTLTRARIQPITPEMFASATTYETEKKVRFNLRWEA